MINKDRLKNICADIGVDLDAQALERFEFFASLLVEKNKVLNLTAITDPEGIAVKHFADSLTALRMIELNAGDRVIDVGTGGRLSGNSAAYCPPGDRAHHARLNRQKARVRLAER